MNSVMKLFNVIKLLLMRDLPSFLIYFRFFAKTFIWETMNLSVVEMFDRVVKKQPNKPAILYQGKAYTYTDLHILSSKISNWLYNSGLLYDSNDETNNNNSVLVRDEDCQEEYIPKQVGLMLGNIPEVACFFVGIARVGASSVMLNPNQRRETLLNSLNQTKCDAVVFEARYLPLLQDVANELPDKQYFMYDRSLVEFSGSSQDENTETSSEEPITFRAMSPADLLKPETGEKFAHFIARCPTNVIKRKYKSNETILYVFTSGTTGGKVKLVHISNYRYLAGFLPVNILFGLQSTDNIYLCLPLYHAFACVAGLGQCLVDGITVTLADKFSASKFWKECRENNCTIGYYIGETCRYLLAQPPSADDRAHSIRMMIGLGLKKEIWAEFRERFNIKKIGEFYGSSEGNAQIYNLLNVEGSCGFIPYYLGRLSRMFFPIYLIKVDPVTMEPCRNKKGLCQIARPGEVGMMLGEIRSYLSHTSFPGYTSKVETSKKIIRNITKQGDFAFVSGDLMKLDENGNVFFTDRTGDTFRWKGENVCTTEVESIASKILGNRLCSVYGVSVPQCDGRAGMIAIEHDSSKPINLEYLCTNFKEQLPEYAVPKFVRLTKNIETTSTFKLVKYQLQKEGIDPSKIDNSDQLFFYDKQKDSYRILDNDAYQLIKEASIKF